MTNPTPQLGIDGSETLDQTAGKCIGCIDDLTAKLRNSRVTIETVDTFLLDSSQHRVMMPSSLNGFQVQMGFSKANPPWGDQAKSYLTVWFVGRQQWKTFETKRGFPIHKIWRHILDELMSLKKERALQQKKAAKLKLSTDRMADLATGIGGQVHDPFTIKLDNLEIQGSAEHPSEVRITVRTNHDSALKIAQEFRKTLRGRPRKEVHGLADSTDESEPEDEDFSELWPEP